MTRYLIDTNVLVNLHDGRDPRRQQRASRVVGHLGRTRRAALSTQVLGEFASVALRKLEPPAPASDVRAQVGRFRRRFPVHPVTAAVVDEALRGVSDHRLGFWDAQVWAIARLHQIDIVIVQDSRPGSLDGVRWLDPFNDTVDIDSCDRDDPGRDARCVRAGGDDGARCNRARASRSCTWRWQGRRMSAAGEARSEAGAARTSTVVPSLAADAVAADTPASTPPIRLAVAHRDHAGPRVEIRPFSATWTTVGTECALNAS